MADFNGSLIFYLNTFIFLDPAFKKLLAVFKYISNHQIVTNMVLFN